MNFRSFQNEMKRAQPHWKQFMNIMPLEYYCTVTYRPTDRFASESLRYYCYYNVDIVGDWAINYNCTSTSALPSGIPITTRWICFSFYCLRSLPQVWHYRLLSVLSQVVALQTWPPSATWPLAWGHGGDATFRRLSLHRIYAKTAVAVGLLLVPGWPEFRRRRRFNYTRNRQKKKTIRGVFEK